MLMKISLLAAPEVVKVTTSSGASDENFVQMMAFSLQWLALCRILLWFGTGKLYMCPSEISYWVCFFPEPVNQWWIKWMDELHRSNIKSSECIWRCHVLFWQQTKLCNTKYMHILWDILKIKRRECLTIRWMQQSCFTSDFSLAISSPTNVY